MTEAVCELPRKFQDLLKPARYKIYYGGRGGAKSWNFARAALVRGAQEPIRVLCARELQNSIAESVHAVLSQQIEQIGLSGAYGTTKTSVSGVNGTEFFFEGVRHNASKIKSMEGIDILWVEEADKVSDESWEILIPTIRKPGSEIWISFNTGFEFDPTYQRFVANPPPEFVEINGEQVRYSYLHKVGYQDNPWFPDELRIEMERLKESDFDAYQNVWEGEVKEVGEGAIYGKQMKKARADGRILDLPIMPNKQIHTFWDLGKNDHTAIWFMQVDGPWYHFIDYHEARLKDLEHYVHVLNGNAESETDEANARRAGYTYGTHYLPHDVDHDILGMVNTRKKQLEDAGVTPISVVQRIRHINEGIEATRKMFAKCRFHETHCHTGIRALQNYRYQYNTERNVYQDKPHHDWASNGADALRQCAQGFSENSGDWGRVIAKSGGIRQRHNWAETSTDWIV